MKAIDLLRKDHATVTRLLERAARTTARAQKTRRELVGRLAGELDLHATVEEEFFYPALRAIDEAQPLVAEAQREHERVRTLIQELQQAGVAGEDFPERVRRLAEAVGHHVDEEEQKLFALAERLGPDELDDLGQQMTQRKRELRARPAGRGRRTPRKGMRDAA